jgi:hypothetical protein
MKQNFGQSFGLRYITPENALPFRSGFGLAGGLAGATFPSAFVAKQQGDKNNFVPRVGFCIYPISGTAF